MLRIHIRQMLLLVACIYSYFPIIALSSTINGVNKNDTLLETTANATNRSHVERNFVWYKLGSCECYKRSHPPLLTAWCSKEENGSSFDSNLFTKMSNVTALTIEHVELKMVPGIFRPLYKLVRLEMEHMDNLTIVEHTFDDTNNLLDLRISSSDLTSLSNIHIPKLKFLKLKRIIKGVIEKDDFIGLPALEKLEVLNSDIRTIHEDAFLPLTQLKHLKLNGNKIVSLTPNHLRNNFQLEDLFLSYDENLKQLPRFVLNSTDNDNYTMREFHSRDCGLEFIADKAFNAMPALEKLILSGNRIKTLPRGLFKPLTSLKLLDISRNAISNIPDNMFEGAIKLSELVLRDNPITMLQMSPFLHTPQLMKLDLNGCYINSWNTVSLSEESIRYLPVHSKKWIQVTMGQLRIVPQLTRVQARYDPIKCNNTLHDATEWLRSHRVKTSLAFRSGTAFCIRRRNKKNVCIFRYYYRSLRCSNEKTYTLEANNIYAVSLEQNTLDETHTPCIIHITRLLH